jgi:hypothetical protein
MPAPPSPLDVANTIVRNLVPVGGILFMGWPAPTVLVLYFADTMLAIAVMFAGLMRYFMPPPKDDGWAARVNSEVGCVALALFLAAFFAVPMGMPVFILLAATGVSMRELLADPSFRVGLVLQAIAAFWSCAGLYRALRTQTPEQLRLKRRFALVFLRWIAVLAVTYTGIVFLFGRFAPFVFVAVYVGVSIFVDIAPDKFLRAMPGGAEDADPPPGAPPTPRPSWADRKRNAPRR